MTNQEVFAERLRTARDKRGLSQGDLAEASGIDRQLISKYERAVKQPGMDGLVRLARALKCSTDYLLGLKAK